MKVLIVNALFHPFPGGVEKHAVELATELVKQGVEVHVLTGRIDGTKAEETYRGIRIHRIDCTELRIPRYYPPPLIVAPNAYNDIAALDAKYRFDVIHLQDRWFPDFNSAVLYAQDNGKPAVVTLHNARPVGIAPHYTVFGGLYDHLIGKSVLQKADKIISVSSWSALDIQAYGIPADKLSVIHNGIDTGAFKPKKSTAFREKHGIKGPMLLFVGRVIRQKGLEYLLEAMPAITARVPEAKLVIIGRGNRLQLIKKMVDKLGLQGNVVFPGFVSEDDLKTALCECDAFVLPSLWEVLPVSILEAMASGKPVVCTNAGGNTELVENGFNGLVVPKRDPPALASACIKVITDKRLAQRMGRNSRIKAANEFSWKKIAVKTIGVYKEIIAENRRNPKRKRMSARAGIAKLSTMLSARKIGFNDYITSLEGQWNKVVRRARRK